MKLEEILTEAVKGKKFPVEITKEYNKLKKAIGTHVDFTFERSKKKELSMNSKYQDIVSHGNLDDMKFSLTLSEEHDKAKVVLHVNYPTKGYDEALGDTKTIAKRNDGRQPEHGGIWYGEGSNSTYWTFNLGEIVDDEPEEVEQKASTQKYNPEQEYQARRNPTQRSNDRARANHQFSGSIGGDSSNYR